MPLYEYECTECGHRTELLQRHGDPPLGKCPQCGGAVRKLFSAPAVQFKGTGWYVTDYARKGQKPDATKSSGSGDKESKKPSSDSSSGSKKADAKSSGSKG
jgi:putative FmdB family regulatory protein